MDQTGYHDGMFRSVHDGSYIRKDAPRICSVAFVLQCSSSGQQAQGTLVEESDSAENYHAEALGAIAGFLSIRTDTRRAF